MAEVDVEYSAPDFATPEDDKRDDDDQPNKSVLIEVQEYLKKAIAEHNSFDVIEPTAEMIMTTQQQVAVQKEVVKHLRTIKTEIDNKIEELV